MPYARVGNSQSKIFKHIEIPDASRMVSQMILTILDVINDLSKMALRVRGLSTFSCCVRSFHIKKMFQYCETQNRNERERGRGEFSWRNEERRKYQSSPP